MSKPSLELANIFKSLGPEIDQPSLSTAQRRVWRDITRCRTAALGGHLEQCDQCGHRQIAYNSCRNRHCPRCQAGARAEWLEERAKDVLPVEYFHVVFTLPEQLSLLALQNKRVIYGLLFKAASETLLEIAADPRHLGAEIGFLAVLHTWGQTLQHHPHVHCVVPGGGLSPDHSKWIACRKRFFLPVKVLSRLFRRKFVSHLREAFDAGKLICTGQLSHLVKKHHWARLLSELHRKEWVVYAKPPFGGAAQVLKYLARYTHRVAISNHRLLTLANGSVTFSYKDYAAGQLTKTMTLQTGEFTRRFLMHVLPRGFVRIRHYGLLANRARQAKLELCRRLIGQTSDSVPPIGQGADERSEVQVTLPELSRCPVCQQGRMIIREIIAAMTECAAGTPQIALTDSS